MVRMGFSSCLLRSMAATHNSRYFLTVLKSHLKTNKFGMYIFLDVMYQNRT